MLTDDLAMAVLEAIAQVRRDDWVPGSLTDWHNKVSAILHETTASHTILVDAIIWLGKKDFVEIEKWNGHTYAPFNFALVHDVVYCMPFFHSDTFQLKVTHQGRQTLDSANPPPTPRRKIGFNPSA